MGNAAAPSPKLVEADRARGISTLEAEPAASAVGYAGKQPGAVANLAVCPGSKQSNLATLLFRGLRVRIGMHTGEARASKQP
jgi:hypothetical protein